MLTDRIVVVFVAFAGAMCGFLANWMILQLPYPYQKRALGIQALDYRAMFLMLLGSSVLVHLFLLYGLSTKAMESLTFFFTLVVIAFIDAETSIIPLSLNTFLILTGLIFGAWIDWDMSSSFHVAALGERIIGTIGGFLVFLSTLIIFTWIFRKTGQISTAQTAMGFGDPLLLAGIGSYVGWRQLPTVVLLACVQALAVYSVSIILLPIRVFITKKAHVACASPMGFMPFGPFLAIAAVEVAFFGEVVINKMSIIRVF